MYSYNFEFIEAIEAEKRTSDEVRDMQEKAPRTRWGPWSAGGNGPTVADSSGAQQGLQHIRAKPLNWNGQGQQ